MTLDAAPRPRTGWGRRLDFVPASAAAVVGIGVGGVLGFAAAGMPLWPGALLFVAILGCGLALAARGQAIPIREAAAFRAPEGTRAEPRTEAQPPPAIVDVATDRGAAPDVAEAIHALVMVAVPGGTFWMGSARNDNMARGNERPTRLVQISPFSCMKYPVTRRLWLEVMGAPHNWWPEGPADDRPVNNLSWYDAVRFCNALSEREGLAPCYRIEVDKVSWVSSEGYRLPTEAEWEYACRAGTRTRWSSGDDETALADFAWFGGNSGGEPQPVGLKRPNPWGLHDMHGNVWEWCWDRYARYPEPSSREPEVASAGPGKGDGRVQRGGSFADWPKILRCAFRVKNWPRNRSGNDGFRCVRGSDRQP